MLDIKDIIKNPENYKKNIAKKGDYNQNIDKVISLYKEKNEVLNKLEKLRAEKNKVSKEIPQSSEKETLIKKMSSLKEELQKEEDLQKKIETDFFKTLNSLPNPADPSVPDGDEEDSVIIKTNSDKPKFDFNPLSHWELGKNLDLIDSEAGAKVAGSRFHFLKNELVSLQFALIQYAFSVINKYNFTPLITPFLVNENTAYGTGYLDSGHEDEVYQVNPDKDNLYLIGTSEIPNIGYYADKIFDKKDLPLRISAFSSCFRREAGSSGKDQKGIIRSHQFDKVEMGIFCSPEDSFKEHELLLKIEEKIWQGLGLHYQVLNIAGKDLGGPAAKKYDIEAWFPGQNKYIEVTSASNCTDFQARRLKIRIKDEENNKIIAHILNGTGIAIGRCLACIMENYQTENGEILIPEKLLPYLNFKKISKK
jgi:seryl-tRNA synthetase